MHEDEIFSVKIMLPRKYIKQCLETMNLYARTAALYCKAAKLEGKEEVVFTLPKIKVLQVKGVEDALRQYGVDIVHTRVNGVYCFLADVTNLRLGDS